MSKDIKVGTTVVLKLDKFLKTNNKIQKNENEKKDDPPKIYFNLKTINRDPKQQLPKCRGKVLFNEKTKFNDNKIIGLQLYPPYFGQSTYNYKNLGEIKFNAPKGSIWYIDDINDISGIILKKNDKDNNNNNEIKLDFGGPSNGKTRTHSRRRSVFSLGTHVKNVSSVDFNNISEELIANDINLPNSYDIDDINKKNIKQQTRFDINEWLFPIFLNFNDEDSISIVRSRCEYELTENIRNNFDGILSGKLTQFFQHLKTLIENIDAIILDLKKNYKQLDNDDENYYTYNYNKNTYADYDDENDEDSWSNNDDDKKESKNDNDNDNKQKHKKTKTENELDKYTFKNVLKKLSKKNKKKAESELMKDIKTLNEDQLAFKYMYRIYSISETVEDTEEAKFALNLLEIFGNNIYDITPILQELLPLLSSNDFMKLFIRLREICKNEKLQIKILETIKDFNNDGTLKLLWDLLYILDGNDITAEKVLISTDNGTLTDSCELATMLTEIFDIDTEFNLIITIYDLIYINMHKNSDIQLSNKDHYLLNHTLDILKLCNYYYINRTEYGFIKKDITNIIEIGNNCSLIPVYELLNIWSKNSEKDLLYKIQNCFNPIQDKYENYQLYLGKYLLYIPSTKADEEDDGNIFNKPLSFQLTLSLINDKKTMKYVSKAIIQSCSTALDIKDNEFICDELNEDEIIFDWKIYDQKTKIIEINNTKCIWVPNLDKKSLLPDDINVSFISNNKNELRGFLILMCNEKDEYSFINDLFKNWLNKNNKRYPKITKLINNLKKQPLFVCMEKTVLDDYNPTFFN